jgi:hypothetical protein
MIRLNAQPFPSSPVSKLSLFLSLPVCRRSSLLTGDGGRGQALSRIIGQQESLALYKSFKTLWLHMRITDKLLHDKPVQKY